MTSKFFNNNLKYFDLQVNGYAGVDFNDINLSRDQLNFACQKLALDKVEGVLATIITDSFEKMLYKIKNLSLLINDDDFIKSVIKGIHIEGPFINPEIGYRGAHPKNFIITPNLDLIKQMLDAGNGQVKLVTLAPEHDKDFEIIKFLSDNGIIVSAGHSNASIEQLRGAIDNGLKMYTHLGNGTPSLLPRHDNIINRVLSLSNKLYITFIADGIHLPFLALNNYLKVVGYDKSIIVTDCMSAASAPPGRYKLSHIEVEVGEDRIVREVGKENLSGSAITMMESENNLNKMLKLAIDGQKKLVYDNPKRCLDI